MIGSVPKSISCLMVLSSSSGGVSSVSSTPSMLRATTVHRCWGTFRTCIRRPILPLSRLPDTIQHRRFVQQRVRRIVAFAVCCMVPRYSCVVDGFDVTATLRRNAAVCVLQHRIGSHSTLDASRVREAAFANGYWMRQAVNGAQWGLHLSADTGECE